MPRSFFLLCLCLLGLGGRAPEQATRPSQDHALFFAVADYDDASGLLDLQNPIKNAEALAALLERDFGFTTEIVRNPTLKQIEDKLFEYRDLYAEGRLPSEGQLLISFSGHGEMEFNEGYFLPRDADPKPRLLRHKALPYTYLRQFINSIDCQHILVAVDACHSVAFDPSWRNRGGEGEFGRPGELSEGQKLLQAHAEAKTRLFFTSDGKGDQTPDQSDFNKKLQEGLLLPGGVDGILTSSDVFAVLSRARPTPHRGEFGDDEPGSSFLFVRETPDYDDLAADADAWALAERRNSLSAYQDYLRRFPQGDFAGVARTRVRDLEAEAEQQRDLADWARAKDANSVAAYERYLSEHPEGRFVAAAEDRITRLKAGSLLDEPKAADLPDGFVFIEGGSFQMGSEEGESDEKPVHRVTVDDFYLASAEVTNEEFCAFLNAKGNQEEGGVTWLEMNEYVQIEERGGRFVPKSGMAQHPVVEVSWYGARAYCQWLSETRPGSYRLPTEAEWEYAAGGGASARTKWAGTNLEASLRSYGNYSGTGGKDSYLNTAPVKSFDPNGLGLYDMSGNVWEWCQDWYDSNYYTGSPSKNPTGPSDGASRVLRGGSWSNYPQSLRVAFRNLYTPGYRSYGFGFRPARSL